jgi:cytochrome c biogenesis protein CcdA
MALGSLAFALFAGTLSVLSPCLLPILPVVFGTAAARHRFAPAALGSGIILSFSGVGLFVATVGFSMGLDGGIFRYLGATVLLGFGAILLSGLLQDRFSLAVGRFGAIIARRRCGGAFRGLGYVSETLEPHAPLTPGAMHAADGVT